ncbi:helix-turn-helix transcriptional regulator [Paenibacillus sp. DMB20]|uniref:helix-turn-helix transcriptional regulator n=1 Tax=Paenibacillus sp. DMB20 TaxID=1642570 RepID=UPI000627A4C2|nr:YafY family protein [Paenibacillus sp. DMB20]KKO52430.1 transcriptional regulator [Paenibacillus sp. DMB20]
MRADRLITIVLLLQNYGRMTSRELADKLETSERTIHRDMEALSMAGVPVYSERGANGGWLLPEDYRTNLTGMKAEEMQTLLLAHPTTVIKDLGLQQVFHQALEKLLAAFPSGYSKDAEMVRERIHVDGAGWHQSHEKLPHLPLIQDAVWREKKMHMLYRKEEETIERIVEPLGLVAKGGIWYLAAACEGEVRTYRISKVAEARLLEESFHRPEPFDLAMYWEQSTQRFKANLPRYPAKLRFNKNVYSRIKQQRYMKITHADTTENEWMQAEVEFHTLESACDILLGLGPFVKVVEPGELREKIIQQAKSILSVYDSDDHG